MTTTNVLPLETWRKLMGFDPYHFWGLSNGKIPIHGSCDAIIQQYNWQDSDAVGRSQIAEAIATAEGLVREYLGFAPAPQYRETLLLWPVTNAPYWADLWGRTTTVNLGEGYLQAVGIEKYTQIGTATTGGGGLVFSDEDGDGLNDTFVATVTVAAGTNPLSLGCYFSAADRLDDEDVSQRWRIAPTRAEVVGTTATLRGNFWQLVRPIRYEGVQGTGSNGLNPDDLATVIVSSLEIWQRTTDPTGTAIATSQAALTWNSHPCHGWWCCCVSCIPNSNDAAATATALARVGIRDARHGIVTPLESVYDADTSEWRTSGNCWAWQPDRVTVRYLAGYPLDNRGQMDRDMATIVARLAAAELNRPICACADSRADLYRWQYDLTLAGESDKLFSTGDPDINNPFGTRRGHVFAWKQIKQRMQMRAFLP